MFLHLLYGRLSTLWELDTGAMRMMNRLRESLGEAAVREGGGPLPKVQHKGGKNINLSLCIAPLLLHPALEVYTLPSIGPHSVHLEDEALAMKAAALQVFYVREKELTFPKGAAA